MTRSLEPINPYQHPEAPAFPPAPVVHVAEQPLVKLLNDWRTQTASTGLTFILIGTVSLAGGLVAMSNEGDWLMWVGVILALAFGAVSLFAGALASFRSITGVRWCHALAATIFFIALASFLASIGAGMLWGDSVVAWFCPSVIALGFSAPIAYQTLRLLRYAKELDAAGIPHTARPTDGRYDPRNTSAHWTT